MNERWWQGFAAGVCIASVLLGAYMTWRTGVLGDDLNRIWGEALDRCYGETT